MTPLPRHLCAALFLISTPALCAAQATKIHPYTAQLTAEWMAKLEGDAAAKQQKAITIDAGTQGNSYSHQDMPMKHVSF